jgi:hypothetical protein
MMTQLRNCDSQNLSASATRLATDCMLSLLLAPESAGQETKWQCDANAAERQEGMGTDGIVA